MTTLVETIRVLPGFDPYALADTPGTGACWFDEAAAKKAIDFMENCLHFVEAEWAGKAFKLELWQQAVVANLFGWKRPDGSRRFRKGLFYVPRKNSKSTTAAAVTLASAFLDGEHGAQIYCAAAEKEQAKFVWTAARKMIEAEPVLMQHVNIYKSTYTVEMPEIGAYIKPLSADADTKHGSNPHWVVMDELHAQKTRDLCDTLESGMGSRRQPMMLYLTTADHYGPSICNEVYKQACAVRDNKGDPNKPGYDAAFLPIIYEAPKGADWKDEKVWAAANPNLDVSVKLDFLRAECRKAQEVTAYENTFRRLYLNQQTEQDMRWIQMDRWGQNDGAVNRESLAGRKCWGGLDLATTTDLAALAWVFPDDDGETFDVLMRFWCPADRAEARERRDKVPYIAWARNGWLTMTDGDVIDYSFIRAAINEDAALFDVQDVGYDKYNATQLAHELSNEDGIKMIEFGQNCVTMNDPCKQFEVVYKKRGLRHGKNPILDWMAGNVSIVFDSNSNFKCDKKKSSDKIDGIVALIMGLARAQSSPIETFDYKTAIEVF